MISKVRVRSGLTFLAFWTLETLETLDTLELSCWVKLDAGFVKNYATGNHCYKPFPFTL